MCKAIDLVVLDGVHRARQPGLLAGLVERAE